MQVTGIRRSMDLVTLGELTRTNKIWSTYYLLANSPIFWYDCSQIEHAFRQRLTVRFGHVRSGERSRIRRDSLRFFIGYGKKANVFFPAELEFAHIFCDGGSLYGY